jgi:hypothetical protein
MPRWLLPVFLLSNLWSNPAFAWNGFGHMEVAAFAWEKLTPTARARVGDLLKLNPRYEEWTEGIAPQARIRFAFIRASTWADAIKAQPGYHIDGSARGNRPPSGPQASQNIGYVDYFQHRYWHFIDFPFSDDGTPLEDPAKPNIQTVIATMRSALVSPQISEDVKSYDLVWLIHLVGDAHQPMRAISRFTRAHPHGDEGGELVRIECEAGCSASNLRGFWDDVLGPSGEVLHLAVQAAAKLEVPPSDLAETASEEEWVRESFEVAKAAAYTAPIDDGAGPFTLTDAYKTKARIVAEQRVALAAVRLANLLNGAFK